MSSISNATSQLYPYTLAHRLIQQNAQRNNFDFMGKGDWFTTSYVGLNLAIPIFDGFARVQEFPDQG